MSLFDGKCITPSKFSIKCNSLGHVVTKIRYKIKGSAVGCSEHVLYETIEFVEQKLVLTPEYVAEAIAATLHYPCLL